uniref:Uncharacterized protein n=1 Tax=Triticum urartu TaxID=4572 RepID=A0A8R7UBK0_TRIUA
MIRWPQYQLGRLCQGGRNRRITYTQIRIFVFKIIRGNYCSLSCPYALEGNHKCIFYTKPSCGHLYYKLFTPYSYGMALMAVVESKLSISTPNYGFVVLAHPLPLCWHLLSNVPACTTKLNVN